MNIRLIATDDKAASTADIVAALLLKSVAGFLFWAAIIAASRLIWGAFHGG